MVRTQTVWGGFFDLMTFGLSPGENVVDVDKPLPYRTGLFSTTRGADPISGDGKILSVEGMK
jgi:hypothetical protein